MNFYKLERYDLSRSALKLMYTYLFYLRKLEISKVSEFWILAYVLK